MIEKKRYYLLKMIDGWHVKLETTYSPSVEYSDVLGPTDEATAKALLKDLDKHAEPE